MLHWYQFFCFTEFLIGMLGGASAVKHGLSWQRGLARAFLIGATAIVELCAVNVLSIAQKDDRQGFSFLGMLSSTLFFGFNVWCISLLCLFVGYLLSSKLVTLYCAHSSIDDRPHVNRNRFGIRTMLALVAAYAAVAAIGIAIE
jgi:hypothetical protein